MAPVARAAAAWVVAESGSRLQKREGNASQTPFLFFIALGVGIVFTNLWVAIGLKYCCRNRRRRIEERAREHHQNFDDLAYYLNPMFAGARRRERKILEIDDLNTRFPVMKYSEWGANREQEGLSTAGGISTGAAEKAQASRLQSTTASISELQPLDEEQEIENNASSQSHLSSERASASAPQSEIPDGEAADDPAASDDAPQMQHNEAAPLPAASEIETKPAAATQHLPPTPPKSPDIEHQVVVDEDEPKVRFDEAVHEIDHDDDDDEPAGEASGTDETPHEHGDEPGDVCSICLETINSEDNVRGLTCHHVFHDDCITRWLTTRKSSCPLCKRDYYTERPSVERPEPAHFDPNGSDDDIPRGRLARAYNNFANRLLYSTMYSRSAIGFGGPGSHIRVRLG